MNAHQTIYIVTPEHTTGSQLFFRDNIVPMVTGKNVLVLAASVTTGYTATAAVEAVKYYNGVISGIAAIFATVDECSGYPVRSVFDTKDLDGYASYPYHECPLCRQGKKLDALVNSFGFSRRRWRIYKHALASENGHHRCPLNIAKSWKTRKKRMPCMRKSNAYLLFRRILIRRLILWQNFILTLKNVI
jgi:hypothetical protein